METGKADDIICDKKNDIESHIKPPEGTKNLKAHSNEQRRKLICQHPLEWDKTFYTEEKLKSRDKTLSDEDAKRIAAKAESLDLWEGIKGIDDLKGATNNLWCNYPIYFINHLDRMNAFEVNPYLGKTIGGRIVKDNPGFAPYTGNGKYDGYVVPSGYFNENYLVVHKNDINRTTGEEYKSYYHEGIDFAAPRTTPIHSFISGTVMKTGTHAKKHTGIDVMGDFMIIQDDNDKLKFYLLVHLLWDSWKEFGIEDGSKIYPGQTIARVSNSDAHRNQGLEKYHLHVSVVRSEGFKFRQKYYESENFPDGEILGKDYRFPVWHTNNKHLMLNPIDNSETWLGTS